MTIQQLISTRLDRDFVLTTDLLVEGMTFIRNSLLTPRSQSARGFNVRRAARVRSTLGAAAVGFANDVWDSNFRRLLAAIGLAIDMGERSAGGMFGGAADGHDSILVGR